MTLAVDLPDRAILPWALLDPRWKLVALVPAALLIGLVHDWRLSLGAFGVVLLLVVVARLPARWYLGRMLALSLFLLLFLAWPVFFPAEGEPTWDIGAMSISLPRGQYLIGVLARALAMVSLVLVVLATAPLADNLKAAHSLRVPGLLIHVTLLTYRYLFLIGQEFRRLRTALRVRAFRNRANLHSYRTIGQVAGTLLVRSHDRAERIGTPCAPGASTLPAACTLSTAAARRGILRRHRRLGGGVAAVGELVVTPGRNQRHSTPGMAHHLLSAKPCVTTPSPPTTTAPSPCTVGSMRRRLPLLNACADRPEAHPCTGRRCRS